MMRIIIALLVFSVMAAAAPMIHEQRNLGYYAYPEFVYSLGVDCDAGVVRVIVMDANFTRLEGVNSYLKYVDFASPLISSETSDENGYVYHELPGNVSLMRGLFILVIEKKGYRSKEIHFDISKCYTNATYPDPPSPAAPAQPPVPPGSAEEEPVLENVTDITPDTNLTNATEELPEQSAEEPCLPSLSCILLILYNLFRA